MSLPMWPTKNGSWVGVSLSFNGDHVLLGLDNSPRDNEYRVMLTCDEARQLVDEIEGVLKRLAKRNDAC